VIEGERFTCLVGRGEVFFSLPKARDTVRVTVVQRYGKKEVHGSSLSSFGSILPLPQKREGYVS